MTDCLRKWLENFETFRAIFNKLGRTYHYHQDAWDGGAVELVTEETSNIKEPREHLLPFADGFKKLYAEDIPLSDEAEDEDATEEDAFENSDA